MTAECGRSQSGSWRSCKSEPVRYCTGNQKCVGSLRIQVMDVRVDGRAKNDYTRRAAGLLWKAVTFRVFLL